MTSNVIRGWAVVLVTLCTLGLAPSMRASADDDLDTLALWLTGSFSSERQAKFDSSYYHVELHMNRIWRPRTDGIWMIVEQAMATSPQAPYRQRVYRIRRVEENMIEIEIYVWKDPKRVIGAWMDSTIVAEMTPTDLTQRRGCEVYLQRDEFKFFGSTHGTACSSDIRGASYATSEVNIADKILTSWDRGYTTDGQQVWGATKGPYYFLRQKP